MSSLGKFKFMQFACASSVNLKISEQSNFHQYPIFMMLLDILEDSAHLQQRIEFFLLCKANRELYSILNISPQLRIKLHFKDMI